MTGSYAEVASPKPATAFDEANKAAARLIRPNTILYTSALLSWLQPFQSGWSTAQMNLSQYNDTDECNARPVADDTCLMFPGHSKLEWTFAVNAWIFGAMIGSLSCGHFSDKYGRKKALMGNCVFMLLGGVVQASVSNVWAFAAGRLISGLASGTATATIGGYINELSPPHMRNTLGLGLQIFTTLGILVPAICFFFANTSSGWRYLAAFPCVLALIYLLLAPSMAIESPAWLLTKGRTEEAKQVIASLYGEEHVITALSWLEVNKLHAEEGNSASKESMFAPRYRMQLFGGLLLSCAQQLSGINAVFYYSGSIFSDAGISDSRIGTLIINFINIWPAFFTGVLANRFGARNMILWGLAGMVVMAIGMTVAFIVDLPALSIVFTALYVIAFGVTLGPLVWVMTADIFPDSIRASASSLCIGVNWLCNLIVGVSYPYISDALDDYAYVPFVVLLAIFYLLGLKLVPETSGKSAEEILAEYDSRRDKTSNE
ncbi:Solute carrier family 2 [Phytophthora cinnamomi]|uniref:Solute carrier family 2 n=1 Tax=Phytophthora cinnamomi TaxID=4785 RepID=UPI0035598862|nr:Solute carrier family 2 [Phytophthora cinnamomi]